MIPAKVLEQHIAILGKTGSGKTYTAKGIAESLLREKRRLCVVDPTSVWWGLRSDSTGKKPAFPIVVFGGEHADVPLGQQHGAAIAEIIGTTDTSAVLDTRLMTVGERTRFFADFGEALLRKNKGPLHLILDEAHLFAPQGRVNDPQSGKMLHAANNLVSLGRGVGLRIILISQRPAKLHKDSLTQAETLIAMRLIAPQDRNAVEDWIGEWADPKQGKELMASLPSLPTGEGWLWSPESGILERKKFPKITTYDSSRAPDGETGKIVLANIDLPTIQTRLEAVAHDAFENDPKRLRAKIVELERAAKSPAVKSNPADPDALKKEFDRGALSVKKVMTREVTQFARAAVQESSESRGLLSGTVDLLRKLGRQLGEEAEALGKKEVAIESRSFPQITSLDELIKEVQAGRVAERSLPVAPRPARVALTPSPASSNGTGLGKGPRVVLGAIAQHPEGVTENQIAVLTGYKSTSRYEFLRQLSAHGFIGREGSAIVATQAGVNELGPDFERLPVGTELRDYWLPRLSEGERKIFSLAIQYGRDPVSKAEIMAATSYKATSVYEFTRQLVARKLLTKDGNSVRLSDALFD